MNTSPFYCNVPCPFSPSSTATGHKEQPTPYRERWFLLLNHRTLPWLLARLPGTPRASSQTATSWRVRTAGSGIDVPPPPPHDGAHNNILARDGGRTRAFTFTSLRLCLSDHRLLTRGSVGRRSESVYDATCMSDRYVLLPRLVIVSHPKHSGRGAIAHTMWLPRTTNANVTGKWGTQALEPVSYSMHNPGIRLYPPRVRQLCPSSFSLSPNRGCGSKGVD